MFYLILAWLYNVLLISGTGYVVFVLGHSGWWFLLTLVLLCSPSKGFARIELAKRGIQLKED